MKILCYCLFIVLCSSCSQQVFIVRHAEKAAVPKGATRMEASDPPLSEAGLQRAAALAAALKNKKIKQVYSTGYQRTVSTVQPVADAAGVPVQRYHPSADSMILFIQKIKSVKKGNILVAGHSNTVDDIANRLAGQQVIKGDLDETVYDRLFILRKKKNGYAFTEKKYGAPSL